LFYAINQSFTLSVLNASQIPSSLPAEKDLNKKERKLWSSNYVNKLFITYTLLIINYWTLLWAN